MTPLKTWLLTPVFETQCLRIYLRRAHVTPWDDLSAPLTPDRIKASQACRISPAFMPLFSVGSPQCPYLFIYFSTVEQTYTLPYAPLPPLSPRNPPPPDRRHLLLQPSRSCCSVAPLGELKVKFEIRGRSGSQDPL